MRVQFIRELSDPSTRRFAFEATVFTTKSCIGFVGYGDADPSNVSPLVHGAEMRVAETRAVNRALRKAYGIGICSVEEIGSFAEPAPSSRESKKLPPQTVNGKNGNYGGPKVRDRLCQLIRQHQLDANLVKCYAVDFCGTKTLREASREQVEGFVAHLADWAAKDRNALPNRIGAGASFHGGGLVTDKPDSPHLLAPKIKARMYFGIASNDDARQPDAKDKLKQAFAAANVPAEIEVYPGALHGWCVPDMPLQNGKPIYSRPDAERAWSKLVALYKIALA